MLDGSAAPKRGDLVQTNIGDRRERTWFVLRSHRLRPLNGVVRVKVWVERWWQLEPDFRKRLYRSALRNGGQQVIRFKRYPPKRRRRISFHDYLTARRLVR